MVNPWFAYAFFFWEISCFFPKILSCPMTGHPLEHFVVFSLFYIKNIVCSFFHPNTLSKNFLTFWLSFLSHFPCFSVRTKENPRILTAGRFFLPYMLFGSPDFFFLPYCYIRKKSTGKQRFFSHQFFQIWETLFHCLWYKLNKKHLLHRFPAKSIRNNTQTSPTL